MWIVAASGLAGLIATVLRHSQPGGLLGVFLIAGTLVAALAVRADAVRSIIPAPTLVYLAASLIAGLIHDRAADTSRTALLLHAVQWISGGFLAITAATLLAIALTVVRRLWTRPAARSRRDRDVGGRYAEPADQEWHNPYDRNFDPYDRNIDPYDRNIDDWTDARLRPPRRYR